uniref:Transposable element Tc3 transposase n=1 Tax=Anoplophora glabripennis TaxID=217634 RepID=V5GKW0_ANOGL
MILHEIEANSSTSVRRISRDTGVPKSIVHRTLRRQLLHPYHVQRVQELLPEDYPRRMQFCREILTKCRRDPNLFNSILWTDECGFKRNGIFNIHNLHFWEEDNPNVTRSDQFQHHFSVNLWAGIINAQLIGPFELSARLNGVEYRRFLENELPVLLEDVLLAVRQHVVTT